METAQEIANRLGLTVEQVLQVKQSNDQAVANEQAHREWEDSLAESARERMHGEGKS